VTVYLGQWFENYRSSAHFWATFFHGTSYVLIVAKSYILGDFFTSSSGHPGGCRHPNLWSPSGQKNDSVKSKDVDICETLHGFLVS
jgi:hypothetical protein